jgi:cytoskeletal protein RodZ
MSEHERGAYTPQPDAPLSFDARVSREARPLPLALIFSCIVLAALVVALFLFYQSGVRKPSDTPPPVGTPVEQFKSPPPAATPNSLTVVAATPAAPAPSAEPIATSAGPEQPVARSATPPVTVPAPAPAPQPAPTASKPVETQVAATPMVKPAATPVAAPAVKPVPTPAAPARVAAAKPTTPAAPVSRADPVGKLLDGPKPAKPVAAKAKPAAVPTPNAAASGAAVVQIGAFATEAQATEGWNRVAGLMGPTAAGKGRKVEPVQVGSATRYRSQVTGFANHAAAVAFCTTLKARHQDCIVKPAS